jgi:hypothetical protein
MAVSAGIKEIMGARKAGLALTPSQREVYSKLSQQFRIFFLGVVNFMRAIESVGLVLEHHTFVDTIYQMLYLVNVKSFIKNINFY